MKLTEKKLKKIVKEEVDKVLKESNLSWVEVGLTAPEGEDYEIERIAKGYDKEEAFRNLKMWAEENGYTVELTGDGTSIFDYTFRKNGSSQYVTVL